MSKQEVIKDTIALKDFLSSVINETLSSKKKLIVEQDEDEKETPSQGTCGLTITNSGKPRRKRSSLLRAL